MACPRDDLLFAVHAFAVSAGSSSSVTQVIGRFEQLKALSHPNLCSYIDVVPGRYDKDKLFVVQEHHAAVEDLAQETLKNVVFIRDVLVLGLVDALVYLHTRNIVHHNWSLRNVLVTDDRLRRVMLSNYGLYTITDSGNMVDFPIGDEHYWSPETIESASSHASGLRSDIWALGVIIFKLYCGYLPFPWCKNDNIVSPEDHFMHLHQLKNDECFHQEHPLTEMVTQSSMPSDLQAFVLACMTLNVSKRPTAKELRQHVFLSSAVSNLDEYTSDPVIPDSPPLNISTPMLPPLSVSEIFYLWKSTGVDIELEFMRQDAKSVLSNQLQSPFFLPAILRSPLFVSSSSSGLMLDTDSTRASHRMSRSVTLDMTDLMKRISTSKQSQFTDSILMECIVKSPITTTETTLSTLHDVFAEDEDEFDEVDRTQISTDKNIPMLYALPPKQSQQPLAVRIRDLDYQFQRLHIFRALLSQYPASLQELIAHSKVDVAPLYRGRVWAAILGVNIDARAGMRNNENDTQENAQLSEYDQWDGSESSTDIDRQIDVDIRRCHSYHPLLNSSQGQGKLRRLIKAWLAANAPDFVYWQGFDSVCAPFVVLLFNDEPVAFACIQRFVMRYLRGFFVSGERSGAIQGHLMTYRYLLSFHDPELSAHLDHLGLHPDLYALSWFLTAFAHVLPMHTLFDVWDRVLVGPRSLLLFLGVAIMYACRDMLLAHTSFDSCITSFAHFPDVNMQTCLERAEEMCSTTPSSVKRSTPLKLNNNVENTDNVTWWEGGITLEQMKLESVPRISMHDCAILVATQPIFIYDCRSVTDFNSFHLVGSINVQPEYMTLSAAYIIKHKQLNQYSIVVCDELEAGRQTARELVTLAVPRLALLAGSVVEMEQIATATNVLVCHCKPLIKVLVSGRTPVSASTSATTSASIPPPAIYKCRGATTPNTPL